jgi:hypothetical protein
MEVHYTKAQINNNISKLLEEGKSNDVAFDFFLMMNMVNDLGPERPFITKAPTPAEVRIHLLGNDAIDKDDVKLEMTNAKIPIQRLVVRLSSNCTLYAELSYNSLQVTVNGRNLTVMYLKYYRAEDIALWLIRQKQKLDEYIEAWDAVLAYACKKVKIDHMAFLGIRAIFTEAMFLASQFGASFLSIHSRINLAAVILARPFLRYSGAVETSTSTPLL